MNRTTFGKVSGLQGRVLPYGADMGAKGWAEVTLDRVDGAPLSFVACQIARHWRQFYEDRVLSITLWRHQKSGYAVAFTLWVDGALRDDSVAVDSLAEAVTFLEDYCAHPPSPTPLAGPICDWLLQIHKAQYFAQSFAFLVGDALAAWGDLDETIRHSSGQNRVTA